MFEMQGTASVPFRKTPPERHRGRSLHETSAMIRTLEGIKKVWHILRGMVWLTVIFAISGHQVFAEENARPVASDEVFRLVVQPFLRNFCVECHGNSEPEAGHSFEELDKASEVPASRKQWEKVIRILNIDGMPPEDHQPRPSPEERKKVLRWLDAKLHYFDCDQVDDSGRVTIRRLNRNEYNNTIRDLLGVDIDPAKDFPSDDVGYGFDNIGDVLSLPPLLLEKYVDAAERIADAAIVADSSDDRKQTFDAAQLKTDQARMVRDFQLLTSRGSVYRQIEFPATDQYVLRVEAGADQAGPELAKMEIRLDGKPVKVHEIQGHKTPKVYEFQLKIEKGEHRVDATFINDYYKPNAKDPRERDRNLVIRSFEVLGPLNAKPPESHQRIIFVRPSKGKSARQAAKEIFAKLMKRAFRRPVDSAEVDRTIRLVEFAMEKGETFEGAVQIGVQAVLVSPHFLFRVEIDPQPNDPKAQHQIGNHELASRLSYFLWSTMPDDELTQLADSGRLHEPKVLDDQVRRMLRDPKSESLVKNFTGQWLNLRNLDEITPDPNRFPSFTPELRRDMVRETELFITTIIQEDRNILDLLDADFSFVNERLARHYGIDTVKGEQFQRVKLPVSQRLGVLTHASILTLTSNPTRTSLVKRGKWILDNVLAVDMPDPPANVPPLEEAAKNNQNASLREQLKIHRSIPGCASCHNTMDPLGFGLENFDAIGRWRTKDEKEEIDSSGTLPSGESFSGPVELVRILKKRETQFARCLAEKMLTFALGRGLEYYDRCAVDKILASLRKNDYRFSVLVTNIVHSKPFLMRRGDERK